MTETIKTSFVFEKEFYKEVKIYCVRHDIAIKDLIESLLRKEMENDKENE